MNQQTEKQQALISRYQQSCTNDYCLQIQDDDEIFELQFADVLKLKSLELKTCKYHKFEAISNNLTKFCFIQSKLDEIEAICLMTQIIELDLQQNYIKDINCLKYMTELQKLCLRSNNITDITPLRDLTALNTLILSQNQLVDISALKNLYNLSFLSVGKNNI
ncbi:leucine-rich_repeat domain-containing protein [Hexamita inflata]|uniref:Leucine-rich repeat domain-containing protein n=1 Tax=Hexamita inflata TaxID=28002 RepID=A0AA86QRC4_9EUKA|nr:leucine-rich repeat domain-containing protein [Hexamita inflata]